MSYKFQTITKSEISHHKEKLMEFFGSFCYVEDYSNAIDNSAFISVCWLDKKIVGAGRVISDLSRFAFIVDLNVKKDHQNKGIGKQLVKDMVEKCLESKIRYIELSTDPQYPWLEDFYKKIGFVKVTDSALMEWPRRNN
jgi:GNAT superfamily N-acetyltransferase